MSEIVANAGVGQFQLLYLDRYCQSNRMTPAGGMLLSSLLGIALWPLVAHEALLGWLLLQGLLQTGHAYYARRYMLMRAAGVVDYFRWMSGFQIGALMKGIGWSLPFFFLSVEHDHPEAILLSFAVAGVTAYAGVAMALVLPVALAFELAAVLPMSAWMFMQDDRIYAYMGTAALLYLGLLYLLLRQLHASSARSFLLGEENRRLADEQRQSELRMARFFESAPGFFYTEYMNGDGQSSMPFASAGIRELFDVTAEEVKENTAQLFSRVSANDLESFVVARDASCKNLSPLHLELRINHSSKGERWIELNSLPQREADGATVWHGFMQDITGRKQLENALVAHERDFRNLAENLPVAVIRYDSECKPRYLNRAAEESLHGSADELLGHEPSGRIVPATPAMIAHYRGKMEESLATGESREFDFVLDELPVNRQEHYEVRFVPEYAADGKPDGVLAIWYDITERKRMEIALQDREKMLEEAQRIAHVGSWDVDMVNDRLTWSDEIFRIWEIDKTKFKADFAAFVETVHPEDRARVVQAYNDAVDTRSLYEVEHRLLFPDGRIKHILERGEPQYDADGKPVRFVGTSLEITERKCMEEELRLKECVLDQANDGVYLIDERGRFVYVNDEACRVLGYSRKELLGMGVADIDHAHTVDDTNAVGKKTREEGAFSFETRHRRRDGSLFPVEIQASALSYRGQHLGLALARDITERKRAKAALEESNQLLRNVLQGIPDPVWMKDADGAFVVCNNGVARLFNMSVDEIIGKDDYDFFPPEQAEFYQNKDRAALEAGRVLVNEEWWTFGDNGEQALMETCKTPVRSSDGKLLGVLGIARDITGRKHTEASLAAREREFRTLAGNIPDNIARWDTEGRYLYINPTHERLLGCKREELVGQPIPASHAHVKAGVAQVAATGKAIHAVRQPLLVEGIEELHDVSLVPEFDEAGKVVGVLGIGRDMTEVYRMQDAICAREQEFRSLAESSPDVIFRYDRACRRIYANAAVVRLTGIPRESMLGKSPTEFMPVPSVDAIRAQQVIQSVLDSGQRAELELTFTAANGQEVVVHNVFGPEFDADGEVQSVLCLGRDITERKRMEDVLAERQAFLDSLFEAIPVPVFYKDREGRYLGFNRAYETVFGTSREQLIGKSVFDTHPRELAETYHAKDAAVFERREALQQYEYRIRHADGTLREVLFSKAAFTDARGEVNGLIGAVIDITERKESEEALRQSETRFRTLYDSTRDAVMLLDDQGFFDCNASALEMFGCATKEEFCAKHPADLSPLVQPDGTDSQTLANRHIAQAIQEGGLRFEWMHRRADNEESFPAEVLLSSMVMDGKPVLQATVRDITERKRAEEALRASEELAQARSNLLNAIVESSPDVIVFALDAEYRYLSFNRKHRETMLAIWGKEIAVGMSLLDVIGDHPDREAAKRGCDRALSGESFVLEESYGDELLSRQYWQNYWSPIRTATGEVVGLTCFVMNVSERRRIEEAMRANEQKLSTLFALSPLGIALTDMNGRYVEFNEAFRAICGYPADELMVLDYWALTPKEYEVQEAAQLESLSQTGRYGPYEKEYRQKDGTLVPIQLNGVLVTGQDGKQYIWSIVEDITERKKTEAVLKDRLERIIELNDYLEENARTLEEHAVELEASQEQLKEALEFSNGVINAIPDILFEMDREGRYHGIWTQQPELLAAQKALLLNKTMHEVLLPETADAALAAIREAEENGFSFGNVIDIVLPSGETRWFELSISRKQGGSLSASRFIVLSRDVTYRKRTEDVLRFLAEGEWMHEGELFLNALVRHLGKSLGVDYVVIDKIADKPGYVETVVRYVKGELVPNLQYGLESTPCGEVMAGTPCCHGEKIQGLFPESGLLKDLRVESYVGIPLRNSEGAAIGLIAVLHEQPLGDAHFVKSILQMVAPSVVAELERSRLEQVLRENYVALNEAQRISHVGNWELDLASGALRWSDEIYRIFEIDPERFGASYEAFLDAIHPDDREAVSRAYETSLETRAPYEIEHRLLFADGRIKHVHERCETRYAEDGKPLRSLGTVQDITERKQAEESLRESYDKIRELNSHLEENAQNLEENARYLEEQATELEASQEQLKQTEAWYRSILHSAPDGMLVVDEQGLIMQVNARIEAMFGYESGELAGNHVEVLLPQAARKTHVDQRKEYFSSGSERRPAMVGKTLFGYRKDGAEFPVDVSLSRLPEIHGRGRAICAAVRDVSERHAMEVAREAALAEALRLAQLRSAFMAQMSHELRTPLNGILGHAQNLLHGGELGKKQIGGLSIIQHSGEHLLSIINGMLDHAAIEADKFELIPGNIQFETFLATIIGMIRVRVEQKNLGFSCVVDADLPAVVKGDAQRLRQVLLNLLSNAIKFTDSGQVSLRVDYIAPQRLHFAVQDSGVGIAADQLESIFLPFEQTGETRRRAGGTGLGLAISRKLVRLMGGEIKVESQPGMGSTFSFEIEMENESSDSAKVDAAALAEQAETRVAQATMMLPVPPRKELETLRGLALRGSMRDVMRHAEKLAEADGRYLPIVEQLRQLAKNFQTKALLSLIEQYLSEQEIES